MAFDIIFGGILYLDSGINNLGLEQTSCSRVTAGEEGLSIDVQGGESTAW